MEFTEFEEKNVLVSGAASGIGYAQMVAFLEQGATVFGVDKKRLEDDKYVFLKREFDEQFTFLQADVSDFEEVSALHERVGAIDILLNTVGKLDAYKKTLDLDILEWNDFFTTNVTSMFLMTNEFLPSMILKKQGVVLNMASIAGLVAGGGGAAYTMSKHAIIGYTKQLALDYAEAGIQVVGVAPGAIDTPMNAADFEGDGEMAKWVASETPVKRWGEAKEVAELSLFLASSHARYLQGTIVPIDGGWTLK
ncbi:MAG: 3-oxoacyl-ACP reductase [Lactobacillales bacterium]|jgi:3-oxoacyl-[acyl-carrier protein] reductase|nr:3-oxoacyl-ACP reductase [Lactobacillales bacterium]